MAKNIHSTTESSSSHCPMTVDDDDNTTNEKNNNKMLTHSDVWWKDHPPNSKTTTEDRSHENNRIVLPKGADGIVKTLVAQEIFLKLVTECYVLQQQRHKVQDQQSEKMQEEDEQGVATRNTTFAEQQDQQQPMEEEEQQQQKDSSSYSTNNETTLFLEIQQLIQQYPGICHVCFEFHLDQNEQRHLYPLAMVCCLERAPLSLIRTAYQANPQALFHAEAIKGCRPLHYACSFRAALDVVQYLYHQDETALALPRRDQMLPLHLATYFSAPDDVTHFLLDRHPHAVFSCDDGFWSALHAAAACGKASWNLVARLYHMNPGAILQVDNKGRTPLHLACWQRGNLPVVRFLLERAPQALYMEDVRLESCLFRAARSQSRNVLEVLLRHGHVHLAAAQEQQQQREQDDDEDGDVVNDGNVQQPIQEQQAPQQAPQQALQQPPAPAEDVPEQDPLPMPPTDDLGATLLHFAALDNTPSVVEFLIQQYPSMVTTQTQDRDEYLPLHTAVHFHAPLRNVELLVEHDPQTLLTPNGHGAIALDLVHKRSHTNQQQQQQQQQQQRDANNNNNNGAAAAGGEGQEQPVTIAQDCAKALKCLALSAYLKDATKNARLANE